MADVRPQNEILIFANIAYFSLTSPSATGIMSAFVSSPSFSTLRHARPARRCTRPFTLRPSPATARRRSNQVHCVPVSMAGDYVQRAILLVDHGSKRAESNAMLEDICALVRARLPSTGIVHSAHMELCAPSISDGFAACVSDGARHVLVVPFFLGPGRHVTKDIPQLAAAAAQEHPGITHEMRPHLGVHESMVDVILERSGVESGELQALQKRIE